MGLESVRLYFFRFDQRSFLSMIGFQLIKQTTPVLFRRRLFVFFILLLTILFWFSTMETKPPRHKRNPKATYNKIDLNTSRIKNF